MVNRKINPGKYPVPQAIIDEAKKKNKYGQAPKWWPTKELVKELCLRVAGGDNIITMLDETKEFPPQRTFFYWLAAANSGKDKTGKQIDVHPDLLKLSAAWARARVARLEHDINEVNLIEHRLISIPQRISSENVDAAGRHYTVINPDALDVQAARTVLESRRWRLSRELPDRFGDKSKVEHSGSVRVERPVDHAPEWMQERIKDQAAKAAKEVPPPAAPAKDDDEATIH